MCFGCRYEDSNGNCKRVGRCILEIQSDIDEIETRVQQKEFDLEDEIVNFDDMTSYEEIIFERTMEEIDELQDEKNKYIRELED